MCSDFHVAALESVGETTSGVRPIAVRCWFTSASTWSANEALSVPQSAAAVQSPTTVTRLACAVPDPAARASRTSNAAADNLQPRRRAEFGCMGDDLPGGELMVGSETESTGVADGLGGRTARFPLEDGGSMPAIPFRFNVGRSGRGWTPRSGH